MGYIWTIFSLLVVLGNAAPNLDKLHEHHKKHDIGDHSKLDKDVKEKDIKEKLTKDKDSKDPKDDDSKDDPKPCICCSPSCCPLFRCPLMPDWSTCCPGLFSCSCGCCSCPQLTCGGCCGNNFSPIFNNQFGSFGFGETYIDPLSSYLLRTIRPSNSGLFSVCLPSLSPITYCNNGLLDLCAPQMRCEYFIPCDTDPLTRTLLRCMSSPCK